jgi:hypothetical protein
VKDINPGDGRAVDGPDQGLSPPVEQTVPQCCLPSELPLRPDPGCRVRSPTASEFLQVDASAERLSRPGEHHAADAVVCLTLLECLLELVVQLLAHRIAGLRPVQGDYSDAALGVYVKHDTAAHCTETLGVCG